MISGLKSDIGTSFGIEKMVNPKGYPQRREMVTKEEGKACLTFITLFSGPTN
jgi:hypothetical protein